SNASGAKGSACCRSESWVSGCFQTHPECACRDRHRTELFSSRSPLLWCNEVAHAGGHVEASVLRQMLPCAALRASLRANDCMAILTQCTATMAAHAALVMGPTGLPRGTEK